MVCVNASVAQQYCFTFQEGFRGCWQTCVGSHAAIMTIVVDTAYRWWNCRLSARSKLCIVCRVEEITGFSKIGCIGFELSVYVQHV